MNRHGKFGVHSVATGNWGCGQKLQGDTQLKLVIQWMAASVAGVPILVYYTSGHNKLSKVYLLNCIINLFDLNNVVISHP